MTAELAYRRTPSALDVLDQWVALVLILKLVHCCSNVLVFGCCSTARTLQAGR